MGIWVKTARLIGAPRPPKSKPPAFAWKIDRRTGKPVRTWRPAKAVRAAAPKTRRLKWAAAGF
ncbi:MAG: hypothetical protein ACXWVO_06555 [Caulobacteraceae bacterium]